MRIIRHPKKKRLKGCVVALGTFDGVHRGHQQIIKQTIKHANKIKAASIALTFDPHPQQLIVPERGLKLLTDLREREDLLAELGIDGVVVFNFNRHLRKLSDTAFVKKYLVNRLGVRCVFVGYDYAFGKGRKGDSAHLKQLGKKFGFEVVVVPAVRSNNQAIKSRIIRELVSQGKFTKAIKLLGHPFQLTGRVIRGSGRGKELGFPTANLQVDPHKLIPAHGVYAGTANGRNCVVNIGARPTFGQDETVIEVHILNFKRNIRNKNLNVSLTKRLRDEFQFSDVEKLKAQIRKDVARVRLL